MELKRYVRTVERKVLDDRHPNKLTRTIFSMAQAAEAAWLVMHIQIARIVRISWGKATRLRKSCKGLNIKSAR